MERMQIFEVPNDVSATQFEDALSARYTVVAEKSISQQWRLYDTFDWRLYGQGWMLRGVGDELALVSFRGKTLSSCRVDVRQPIMPCDLPAGALRRRLKPVVKARALLMLAATQFVQTTYHIFNRKEKKVAQALTLELHEIGERSAPPLAIFVSLQAVNGSNKHLRRLVKELPLGNKACSLDRAIYDHALAVANQVPYSYSAKLDVQLQPDQRADEATRAILRRLLATIRANENGIRDDIDIEFLHDYRVAIRRTRSALSQMRGVFPAATTAHYNGVFRDLGQRTNQLRDLDVYLLAEPDYQAMLPPALCDDISPLFDLLRSQRANALTAVTAGLNTSEYEQVLASWADFLNQPGSDDPTAPNAATPIIELAKRRIYRRYKRIVKNGTYILDHTEDELLHDLRLECKKLRYLLEFFASLFPRKQVRRLVKELQALQENLGDFTDLSVQQESLLLLADELPPAEPRTGRALLATGALVAVLAQRQQAVKADFTATFTRFAASENQRQYRVLFAPKRKQHE
jgi:CHAD domain-containing protein